MDFKMALNALDAVMRQSNRKFTASAVKDAYSNGDICLKNVKNFSNLSLI